MWAETVDLPAGPSSYGEGLPPPPLRRGGEAAGVMAEWKTSQGERDGEPHTRVVSSELPEGLAAN